MVSGKRNYSLKKSEATQVPFSSPRFQDKINQAQKKLNYSCFQEVRQNVITNMKVINEVNIKLTLVFNMAT